MTATQFYSPLRYPGGKNKLAKFISTICVDNDIKGHYVEPYAGGAAVALHLLLTGKVKHVTINDYDLAIFAFWHCVLNYTESFCTLIDERPVDMNTWNKCREILSHKDHDSDLLELGYATLFLNRTNYSGILNGGVIGGKSQAGTYKMDCRFNKKSILNKIKLIASYRDEITLTNLDALELIDDIKKDKNTLFYFDPPYYLKGPSLYMNHYNSNDHYKVSEAIKQIKKARWIVSYDNTPPIRKLYKGMPTISYSLSHSARTARAGLESIFTSHNLIVDTSKHPVEDYR